MMKRIFKLIYICCTLVLFAGCSNNEKKSADSTDLTSIPETVYLRLLGECDYVDIIFFDSPVSMSQDDEAGIQSTLTFISKQLAKPDPDCKPLGRISYMIKGDIIAEGDFYCTEGCTYILFMEENKPKYANVLSPGGIQFFQNILLQIQKKVDEQ
jgi:hypothetical protein